MRRLWLGTAPGDRRTDPSGGPRPTTRAAAVRPSAPVGPGVARSARTCYPYGMQAVATKHRILDALNDLADDASIEEAIERLYLLDKAEKGFRQLDAGQSLDHEEVKRRIGL